MFKSQVSRLAALAVAVLAPSVLAPSASRAADVPGVTADAITIGIHASLTGPSAIWGSGQVVGASLYFNQLNEAGGINGRKIKWVIEDAGTSPPRGIAAYRKLADSDVFAIFGPNSSTVIAASRPVIDEMGVPTFISISSTLKATTPFSKHVFRTGPVNDVLQGSLIADFAVVTQKAKKIAIISQSDESGKEGAESVIARLKSKHGTAPVAHEVFNAADTDFQSQLLKIRAAEPDLVVIYGFIAPAAIIVRQAKQLGLKAQLLGSNGTSSRNYPKVVGEAATGVLNVITLANLPESEAPEVVKFRQAFEKAQPSLVSQGRPDIPDMLGYGGAMVFAEGLKRAGRDITRARFIAALETLSNFETGIILPTTFTAGDHDGNKAARVLEIGAGGVRKMLDTVLREQ